MNWAQYMEWCGDDEYKIFPFHLTVAKVFFDEDKEDIKMLGGERLLTANKKAYRHTKLMCNLLSGQPDQRAFGLSRKTRVRCSCYMCGHRRVNEGPPIREIRSLPLPEDFE